MTGIKVELPTDPTGKAIDPSKSTYNFYLETKSLSHDGKIYMYFDKAKVIRQ